MKGLYVDTNGNILENWVYKNLSIKMFALKNIQAKRKIFLKKSIQCNQIGKSLDYPLTHQCFQLLKSELHQWSLKEQNLLSKIQKIELQQFKQLAQCKKLVIPSQIMLCQDKAYENTYNSFQQQIIPMIDK